MARFFRGFAVPRAAPELEREAVGLPARIKNRFSSIIRCLDLSDSPGPFKLEPNVVPVVTVAACLETLAFNLQAIGAAAIATTTSTPQPAGLYRIYWAWSLAGALASANSSQVSFLVGSALVQIAEMRSALVGDKSCSGWAEVNVAEGCIFQVLADGSGAGNVAHVRATVQRM